MDQFLRWRPRLPLIFSCLLAIAAVLPNQARAEDILQQGKRLYSLCSACHGPRALGVQQYRAPALAGLPDWYLVDQLTKFRDGRRGAHPDDVAGLLMRPMSRALQREKDVKAVAAYISTLQPKLPKVTVTGGDPQMGQTLYMVCVACHGANLEGNKELRSPGLKYLPDWYQLAQLKNYKNAIRGTDATDPQAMQMQAVTMGLQNEKMMIDVVAYINKMARQ